MLHEVRYSFSFAGNCDQLKSELQISRVHFGVLTWFESTQLTDLNRKPFSPSTEPTHAVLPKERDGNLLILFGRFFVFFKITIKNLYLVNSLFVGVKKKRKRLKTVSELKSVDEEQSKEDICVFLSW